MKSVTIHAAKTHLSALIEEVNAGEEIIIARGKVPVARLLAFRPRLVERVFGAMKGRITVDDRFFEPLPEEELAAWGQ
jgi:prevent-host-death family protein